MNANTEVDLDTLESAIVADIKAQFPSLATVEFYRQDRLEVPTPAVLLEMVDWELSEDHNPGTEQLPVIAHFEAQIIIGFRNLPERKAKSEICRLASALGAFIHNRRWNTPGFTGEPGTKGSKLPTGPVQVVGAYPDDFQGLEPAKKDTKLDRFEIWRLAWQQQIDLGQSVWNWVGETPTAVFVRETIQPFDPGPIEPFATGVQGE